MVLYSFDSQNPCTPGANRSCRQAKRFPITFNLGKEVGKRG